MPQHQPDVANPRPIRYNDLVMETLQKKTIFKKLMMLALPMAAQNLLTYAVGLVDSIMVGALGEAQLSAVTVANQPFFLFMMVIFGLSSGAGAMISQYWGMQDKDTISRLFGLTMRLSMLVGVVMTVLVLLLPEQVMRLYTNEAEVIAYGVRYLRVVGYSYIFFSFSGSYLYCIRNVERVKIAVITYGASFVVNVFFNYMFIFGKFGAPELGVAGAAVGTVMARVCEFIIVIFYSTKKETRVRLRLKYLLKTEKTLSRDYARISVPVLVNEIMWASGTSAQMAILGRMGVAAVATVSVVTSVSQIMTVLVYGAGSATLVIVGKYIGSRDYAAARQSAPFLVLMNVVIAAVTSCVLLLLRDSFIGMYNVTESTKALVETCIGIAAVIIVFQAITLSCIVGVFRGGGDTVFAMVMDTIGVWGIAVPLGAIGGLALGLSVPVVYLLLRCEEIVKAILCLLRLRSGKWLRNVTRDSGGRQWAVPDGK